MSDAKSKIIIKRVKKVTGGGAHGGSWKVAYADFVTAMMAFFLLMWLLSMTAPEQRARISTYFKSFSIFEKSGSSFMDKSSEVFKEAGESKMQADATSTTIVSKPEQLKDNLRGAIENKLGDIKDQIMVDIFEGGVRIQLVDKEGQAMFDVGSAHPTSMAQRILKVIGDSVTTLPNPVSIEGHTDSLTYKSNAYSNWELSTERALTARKELERFGLAPDRITRVAGYASTVPFIKDNPADPRNRRISIILLFPEKDMPQSTAPIAPAPAAVSTPVANP